MIDKQDIIVSLLKGIDKNIDNLGVGGGNTPTSISGGYPVVTVTDDFNIEAQPNTFYNIKNSADSEVVIDCVDGYSIDGMNKHIMFTFDGWDSEELSGMAMYFTYLGGVIVPDTTKEGYSYKMEFDLTSLSGGEMTGIMSAYFTDEVKTGNSVTCFMDMTAVGEGTLTIPMNNIQILTENINDLVWITVLSVSYPHIFTEVENDNDEYQHKYEVLGLIGLLMSAETIYTNESYTTATNFYVNGMDISFMFDSIEVKTNISIPSSDTASEFIFNVNSPANITFNVPVNWNNDSAPDLTQTGTYTISIVNSVGCYTFI